MEIAAAEEAGSQHLKTNFEVTFGLSNLGVIHYWSTGNN
jgi:hypothetical protein